MINRHEAYRPATSAPVIEGVLGGIMILIVLLALSACASTVTACPPPNYMDEKVAEELELIPFEGNEDLYDWLAEIETLNEQLDVCN
jgi:hypothetical protein